jgi:hypothetical protein
MDCINRSLILLGLTRFAMISQSNVYHAKCSIEELPNKYPQRYHPRQPQLRVRRR